VAGIVKNNFCAPIGFSGTEHLFMHKVKAAVNLPDRRLNKEDIIIITDTAHFPEHIQN
jgi:hypothetical protein